MAGEQIVESKSDSEPACTTMGNLKKDTLGTLKYAGIVYTFLN